MRLGLDEPHMGRIEAACQVRARWCSRWRFPSRRSERLIVALIGWKCGYPESGTCSGDCVRHFAQVTVLIVTRAKLAPCMLSGWV